MDVVWVVEGKLAKVLHRVVGPTTARSAGRLGALGSASISSEKLVYVRLTIVLMTRFFHGASATKFRSHIPDEGSALGTPSSGVFLL